MVARQPTPDNTSLSLSLSLSLQRLGLSTPALANWPTFRGRDAACSTNREDHRMFLKAPSESRTRDLNSRSQQFNH